MVIIGKHDRLNSWQDWDDRSVLRKYDGVRNRMDPPFYVVVGKSNRYSQTYEGFTFWDLSILYQV